MSNEPRAGMNLDPELLAAYVDKRLTPEQRAAVEAQLASDPDAYAVLVETLKAQEALGFDSEAAPTSGRRSWVLGGSALAAAAAIALVIWTTPGILQRLRGDRVDPRLERLVVAVGEERYIEARLTGGFRFGPLRSASRGAGDTAQRNLELLAAAGELQKRAEAEASAENLHAWGAAQLLLGDADGAAQALEAAVLEQPQSAVFLSDLAAAYLTRYQWAGNPQDLPRALDAVERARSLPDAPLEALFTRSLALELMKLDDMAAAAWREYLSKDGESEWAAEANRRLEALSSSKPVSRWESLDRDLLGTDGDNAVAAIVREFPEEVPDVILGRLLPAWAAAATAANQRDAALFLRRAATMVADLAATGGDPALRSVISQLSNTSGTVSWSATSALGSGIRELDADQYVAADSHLTSAYERFPAGSVLRGWSAFYLARVRLFLGRTDDSLALLEEAGAGRESAQHPQLAARATWIRGIIRFTQGRHDEARRDYQTTIALHERAHEPRAGATAVMNLSVVYRFWGDRDRSWRFRLQGSWLMPRHRPNRYYGFLTSTAISASLDEWPNAAVAVIDEAVLAADRLPANLKAESRLQRSRLLARAGLSSQAISDLTAAEVVVAGITDEASRTRTEATLKVAKAEVLQDVQPEEAAAMARDAAIAFRARGDNLRSAELALYEARSRSNAGDDAGAMTALESGIEAFEAARTQIPADDPARISALEPGWALFDEDFARRVRHADFDRALAFRAFEASRARTIIEARSLVPMAWSDAKQSLTASQVLVLLHQRDRELLVWLISATDDRLFRLAWSRPESQRLVALSRREIARPGPAPAGAQIFNLLIQQAASSLADGGTIIIVPDGAFRQMPWAALRDDRNVPAIARWAFTVSPSATLALRGAVSAAPESALVIGVSNVPGMPRLPGVPQESRKIASIYPHSVLVLDADATADAVVARLDGASVVHIATHAIDSPAYPLLSRLLLADGEDGGLTAARIIRDVRANGAVVVLAACNSIGGAVRQGEGTIGLAWAFLMADATAVIGSLWPLDDAASVALFVDLHSNLRRGLAPSAALRAAQLAAWQRGTSVNDWAAVQVVGHP